MISFFSRCCSCYGTNQEGRRPVQQHKLLIDTPMSGTPRETFSPFVFDALGSRQNLELMGVRKAPSIAEIVRLEFTNMQNEIAPYRPSGSDIGASDFVRDILLRKKIGKRGDAPSKTGLNQEDAYLIDDYVNANKEKWRSELLASGGVIKVKKDGKNNLPRSLRIGFETLPDGTLKYDKQNRPIMRVMVLCKSKVSVSELSNRKRRSESGTSKYIKVTPIGLGSSKVVKPALDWLTGEKYAQLTFRPVDAKGRTVNTAAVAQRELHNMQKVLGRKGVAKPAFMLHEEHKFDQKAKTERSYHSFFMPRYKTTLEEDLESDIEPFSLEKDIPKIRDLADALISCKEAEIIHCDGKLNNTLVDYKGTLAVSDYGLAMEQQEYLQEDLAVIFRGNFAYFSPEVMNTFVMLQRLEDVAQYPYARDMWSSGWQALYILAVKEDALNELLRSFLTDMMDLGVEIKKCHEEEKTKTSIVDRFLINYDDTDTKIDQIFAAFEEHMKSVLTSGAALEKTIALLGIVRKMLRASPAQRITPEDLKRELDLLS